MVLLFALYVHSLPPTINIEELATMDNLNIDELTRGVTFEEAMQAEMANDDVAEPEEGVLNLDGDNL